MIFCHAMILIREERAAHVMVVEEFRGAMPVVDRENVSALEAPPDFHDPITSFESSFRLLAFAESNSLRGEVFCDGTSGKLRDLIHESPVSEASKNFFWRSVLQEHAVYRQCVNQLIGNKTAGEYAEWDLSR